MEVDVEVLSEVLCIPICGLAGVVVREVGRCDV